ncbi:LapA family protein [Lactobacillus sp. LC28-10]|uniref:LapA family protein n=1 Tax=Secundilactobacillus angelensis TaxID=2722706 RepID=A0ABX1KWT8_9LACO|nr:LapA family protein [Secundilactobacillus angelensis]MCH5461179.1 LapA family protein [Secundilactobacillus angelensis]NLR17625.1 LapA family protein [Secundilactobacillus angelensis]
MKRQGKVIIAILIVILIAVFSVMNTESIPVHFGFATVSWPLVLVLLAAVFLGAILMFLFATITNYQNKKMIKQQSSRIQTLETRLDQNKTRVAGKTHPDASMKSNSSQPEVKDDVHD